MIFLSIIIHKKKGDLGVGSRAKLGHGPRAGVGQGQRGRVLRIESNQSALELNPPVHFVLHSIVGVRNGSGFRPTIV